MLPFLIHKVLLQPGTWEESKAKQNQATASPDPRWTAEKNLILFRELVVSFIAVAPNSKSGAIPQGQLAARAFPQPLESGTLQAAVCGGLRGQGRGRSAAGKQKPWAPRRGGEDRSCIATLETAQEFKGLHSQPCPPGQPVSPPGCLAVSVSLLLRAAVSSRLWGSGLIWIFKNVGRKPIGGHFSESVLTLLG